MVAAAGEIRPLTGEVALVTGASRGLGATIARTLARAGASVAAVSRDAHSLEQVVDAIMRDGGVASAYEADVADEDHVRRVVERTEEALGPITLLVNNAGVLGEIGPFADAGAREWWHVMEVNLQGAAACMRAVLPFRLFGTYTTVSPPATIVLSWSWESSSRELGAGRDTRVTVSFREALDGTNVMVTHEGFPTVAARDAHIRGWPRCLTRMRELYLWPR